jgi:hypothetical protein
MLRSFSIYFEDEDDINQTAMLCYYKIPWFQTQFPNNTFEEIVKYLIQHAVNVNVQDKKYYGWINLQPWVNKSHL